MEVYKKKPNGRYEAIGWEWTGFPADGIWLVQDGTQNCLIRLGDVCKKPKRYVELAQYKQECARYVIEKIAESVQKDPPMYSTEDLIEWVTEFYADKLGE